MDKVWQLKSLYVENVFCYEKMEFNFNKDTTALVVGNNRDDFGADSNGSGKSSLLDSITWTLWGKVPRTGDFSNIVLRRGQDTSTARLILVDQFDNEVKIERSQGVKSNLSFMYRDKSDVAYTDLSLRTKSLTQKDINKFFGFHQDKGFEDYLSQVCFSASSSKGFLSSDISPMERQRVLERFLGIEIIDAAIELVKLDAKDIDAEVMKLDNSISVLKDLLKEYNVEELVSDLEKFKVLIASEKSKLSVIKNCRDFVNGIKGRLSDSYMAYKNYGFELNKHLDICQSTYDKLGNLKGDNKEFVTTREMWEANIDNYKALENKYNELSSKLKDLHIEVSNKKIVSNGISNVIGNLSNEVESYRIQIESSQLCPNCKKPLMVFRGGIQLNDIDSLKNKIDEITIDIKEKSKELQNIDSEISDIDARIFDITASISDVNFDLNKLKNLKAQYDKFGDLLGRISSLEKTIERLDIEYKSLVARRDTAKSVYEKIQIEIAFEYNDYIKSLTDKNAFEFSKVDYTMLAADIDDLSSIISSIDADIAKFDKNIWGMQSSLDSAEASLAKYRDYSDRINEFNEELTNKTSFKIKYDYWLKTFPEIKKITLNTFMPYLQNKVNQYLEGLGVVQRIKFLTDSEGASGNIKSGFVIKVFDGHTWANFNSYSGGESSRILIAAGVAQRDISIERSNKNGLGFILVDELLDKIDASGISCFFNMIKSVPGQKLIITHTKSDDIAVDVDEIIQVTKYNGISFAKRV